MLIGGDRFGGRSVNINRALRFQECLDICKMINIGFSSVLYMSNNRPLTQLVQERIDRYFINAEWYVLFPEDCDEHLERGLIVQSSYIGTKVTASGRIGLSDSSQCGFSGYYLRRLGKS